MMMNTVAPVWDGNETWLVLGGGGLLAAFPLAYADHHAGALSADHRDAARPRSSAASPSSSAGARSAAGFCGTGPSPAARSLAAFAQGIALGALVQGIPVAGRAYAGGWLDWLTPFSLLTGAALVVGYALLGATWLILKTEGALQDRAYALARAARRRRCSSLIGAVSLWTPFLDPRVHAPLVPFPAIVFVAPVPLLVPAPAATVLWLALDARSDRAPFLGGARPVRAVLCRPRDQLLSLYRAALA